MTDLVTSPSHYTRLRFECEPRHLTELYTGNVSNVLKYLCRAGYKEGASREQDLRKAKQYAAFAMSSISYEYLSRCEDELTRVWTPHVGNSISAKPDTDYAIHSAKAVVYAMSGQVEDVRVLFERSLFLLTETERKYHWARFGIVSEKALRMLVSDIEEELGEMIEVE